MHCARLDLNDGRWIGHDIVLITKLKIQILGELNEFFGDENEAGGNSCKYNKYNVDPQPYTIQRAKIREEKLKKATKYNKKRTTLRIPTWSPTVVLTEPEHA